ncbi:hemolysin family protein [Paraflavisolibacter sp. H34]|uniref:hemolysin family protein n=1 Tax=Huijunlia imazamoxiresistens TaxID=3127457 RepID=UPI00301B4346
MEFIIIFVLIFINGFFALSEISVVSARPARLDALAKKGDAGARRAAELAKNPSRFLSTVQVGITLIGILTGIFGGEAIAEKLEVVLQRSPLLAPYSSGLSVAIVVIIITYFSIVIGELVPKRIGLTMPEKIAPFVSRPMFVLSKIAAPFIWLLSKSTELLIRLFKIKRADDNHVTEEEIKAIVQESAEAGAIDEIEHEIVTNIFQLGDRTVSSLMTPRNQLVWIDSSKPFAQQMHPLAEEDLAIYPVCRGDLDEIEGVFHLRDYARALLKGEEWSLAKWVKKPQFLPENMKAYKALAIFQETRVHFGVVVDEYGSIQGVITLNDLLDAMVGDIITGEGEERNIVQREDGSWLVSGSTHIDDLTDLIGEASEERQFNTVAGLVLHAASHIPRVGFQFKWKGHVIEVVDMDGHKVDKVLIRRKETSG